MQNWVDSQLQNSLDFMDARYTELATAFAHVVRAVSGAGLYDQLVALLVELFTEDAKPMINQEDDDEEVEDQGFM